MAPRTTPPTPAAALSTLSPALAASPVVQTATDALLAVTAAIDEELARHASAMTELADRRSQVVHELKAAGLNNAEIGRLLGITRGRVHQIALGGRLATRTYSSSE